MTTKRELVEKIYATFTSMVPPDIIVAQDTIDSDGADSALLHKYFDNIGNWRHIQPEIIESTYSAMPFFAEEAFRFYLPAFLIRGLDNANVMEWTCNYLCLTLGKYPPKKQRTIPAYFTDQELSVIIGYLEYAQESWGDTSLSNCIETAHKAREQ